jgi:hypothetical protein
VSLWYGVAVALVFGLYAVVCLTSIDSVWQWGHNGFNGASYAQAARNSLRFEILGQAKYHTGLEPPPAEEIFTHHPMMIHLHLLAVFRAFGYSELAARAVPAFYSMATLVALFFFARRYYGRAVALLAAALFVVTPINAIYANMVDHEQGSLFCTIALIYAYCRWRERPGWKPLVGIMVAVTFSVQFAWPGYYVALFIVLHAFAAGLREPAPSGGRRSVFAWRPDYTLCALFSVVVLANFGVFYAFIVSVRGGFHEMMQAFDERSDLVSDYARQLWKHTVDLQGILPILLLAAWLPLQVVRERRGQQSLGDLLPIFFLFAQAVNSTLFAQAGYIHAYWTYHASPTIAVGGALVLWTGWRWLAGRERRPARRRALGVALAVLVLGGQLAYAADRFFWGYHYGHGAYTDPYDDQYLEAQWLLHLTQRFNRSNADFVLTPDHLLRIERLAYLDAPITVAAMARPSAPMLETGRHQVFLFDLHNMPVTRRLGRLVRDNPTWVYDRRFVVVDAGSADDASFTALVSEPQPASLWWRWLVNMMHPPIRWVPDPLAEQTERYLVNRVNIALDTYAGGSGGAHVGWDCGPGQVLGGLHFVSDGDDPVYVSGIRPLCRSLAVDEAGAITLSDELAFAPPAPTVGDPTGRVEREDRCPEDMLVVGLRGVYNEVVDGLGLTCARPYTSTDRGARLGYVVEVADPVELPLFGQDDGEPFDVLCPAGSVGWGVRAREGNIVDAAGLSCARVDQYFFGARNTREAPRRHRESREALDVPRIRSARPGDLRTLPPGAPSGVMDVSDTVEGEGAPSSESE